MKKMVFLIVLQMSIGIYAQTSSMVSPSSSTIWDEMPNAKVVQDSSIVVLMQEKRDGFSRGQVEQAGWRVQVYSSNEPIQAKTQALQVEERLKSQTTEEVYIISAPPFIKVRVGDFLTKEEAMKCKNQLVKQFPDLVGDTYVVRDEHIRIRK